MTNDHTHGVAVFSHMTDCPPPSVVTIKWSNMSTADGAEEVARGEKYI